jgi:hypothetical protein
MGDDLPLGLMNSENIGPNACADGGALLYAAWGAPAS